jgi:hypothetical protein
MTYCVTMELVVYWCWHITNRLLGHQWLCDILTSLYSRPSIIMTRTYCITIVLVVYWCRRITYRLLGHQWLCDILTSLYSRPSIIMTTDMLYYDWIGSLLVLIDPLQVIRSPLVMWAYDITWELSVQYNERWHIVLRWNW